MANERLRELRTLMKVRNVDAYYVPSSDFHDSEYVEDYFKCRAFLSGFTGSAGTMVITQAFSGMWTDGRYFVQAKKELEGQDTRLMAMGEEGVPTIEEYLMDHMPEGGVLGFDGRVVNAAQGRKFETMMAEKHATLSVGDDLAGEVWEERPILPGTGGVGPRREVRRRDRCGEACPPQNRDEEGTRDRAHSVKP